jgi:hypothetical protein
MTRMRCIVFCQYEDFGDASKIYDAMSLEREKSPDKFPKQMTPTYMLLGDLPELKEKVRGLYVIEAESQKQINDFWVFWHSKVEELGFKEGTGVNAIIPLVDGFDIVNEWKAQHK